MQTMDGDSFGHCPFVLSIFFMGLCMLSRFLSTRRPKTPLDIADVAAAGVLLDNDMLLYHQLQTLEDNPEALSLARERLIQLFDITIHHAMHSNAPRLLVVKDYSLASLKAYSFEADTATAHSWSSYMHRRSCGGPRELLSTPEIARYWLRASAPAKYVDGAWLSRIHHARTSLNHRSFTSLAWQILSEELGDGMLERNHVHVYSSLLESLNAAVGSGDSQEFIQALADNGCGTGVWRSAIAQLAIGFLPDDFLPEILGFNLAYEAVTIETLICAYELKELGLDPTYFNLHITIDNADSGHSAMASEAVDRFMATIPSCQANAAWRRVQAGYLLANGLPATASPPRSTETKVLDMFARKCAPAKYSHQRCKGRIGKVNGRTLQEWLNPASWDDSKLPFLVAFGHSQWITAGDAKASNFVREISWGGRMFGAFTTMEKAMVEDWIQSLRPTQRANAESMISKGTYAKFIGPNLDPIDATVSPSLVVDPLLPQDTDRFRRSSTRIPTLPSLLLESVTPLQRITQSPAKCATNYGMAALRVLRILNGLPSPGQAVLGMDQVRQPSLGVADIAWHMHDQWEQSRRAELLGDEDLIDANTVPTLPAWTWLGEAAERPYRNYWFLIGAQEALVEHLLRDGDKLRSGGASAEEVSQLQVMAENARKELAELDNLQPQQRQDGYSAAYHCLLETRI